MMKWMTCVAMAAVLCIAGVVEAKAAKKAAAPAGDATLAGQISDLKIDATAKTVSITVAGHGKVGPTTVLLTDSDNPRITLDGQPARITDLKSGEYVKITPATGSPKTIAATTAAPAAKKK